MIILLILMFIVMVGVAVGGMIGTVIPLIGMVIGTHGTPGKSVFKLRHHQSLLSLSFTK